MQLFTERYRSPEKLLNREQKIEMKSPRKRKSSLPAELLMRSMTTARSVISTHKNNLKMGKRPKCEAGHYKTQRKTGKVFFDKNCSKIFFDPLPRVMRIKTKINK